MGIFLELCRLVHSMNLYEFITLTMCLIVFMYFEQYRNVQIVLLTFQNKLMTTGFIFVHERSQSFIIKWRFVYHCFWILSLTWKAASGMYWLAYATVTVETRGATNLSYTASVTVKTHCWLCSYVQYKVSYVELQCISLLTCHRLNTLFKLALQKSCAKSYPSYI